ncbi:MAG: sensor histidine kinase [Acetivibrionales bacterium]
MFLTTIKSSVKSRFNNYPLKVKIMVLILGIIFLTTTASFIGIHIISNSNNKLLYKALAGSLSYSASDISTKLSNIEAMSSAIVSSKDIKKNLITISDETNEIKLTNAQNTLDYMIFDYYQSNRTNCISYINLYSTKHVTYSFEAQSQSIPDSVLEDVIEKVNKKDGYPCWITDYCNDYGLFLGRDCRRVDQMSYKTLGTLVVNVDLEKLINSSTKSILFTNSAQYILYDNSQIIYQSVGLNATPINNINSSLAKDYDVLKLGENEYFCIRGTFDNMDWEYICLIPYDNIASALNFSRFLSLSVVMLIVVVSLITSNLITNSITAHFRRLLIKMDKFGKNEYILPSPAFDYHNRNDEIGVLHNQFDKMVQKIQQLIEENYVIEILAKDARIKALENQINPHFLYNTLESINWRAKAIGEKEISVMIEALGALLRITLSQKETTTTLEHELQIVRNYIAIQQIRFEDRLSYEEDIDENLLEIELPQLTIQPLVENAINYVLEEIVESCCIKIEATSNEKLVVIRVINNGSQFEENILQKLQNGEIKPHGFGIGLLNIHRRLQLIFGTDYGLVLYNSDENHAVAQINIPRRQL